MKLKIIKIDKMNPLIKDLRIIVGLIAATVFLIFSLYNYIYKDRQRTDNAQMMCDVVPIPSEASGVVVDIRFKDNEMVNKGDILAKINPNKAESNLLKAKAVLMSEELEQKIALVKIKSSKVSLKQAQSKLVRQSKLYKKEFISKEGLEDAQIQFDIINANLELANAEKELSSARIKSEQANVEIAKIELSNTTIISKRSGIADNRTVSVGQRVEVGQPIVYITTCDEDSWVEANFKETQIANMKVNDKAIVSIDAYNQKKIKGYVESISGGTGAIFSLLPPENSTGNFTKVVQRIPVRIRLTNVTRDTLIRSGMSVIATVYTEPN